MRSYLKNNFHSTRLVLKHVQKQIESIDIDENESAVSSCNAIVEMKGSVSLLHLMLHRNTFHSCIVMQEASDALSKTADSDAVSTYQVSSVQLVTDKKLEAFNKAYLKPLHLWDLY